MDLGPLLLLLVLDRNHAHLGLLLAELRTRLAPSLGKDVHIVIQVIIGRVLAFLGEVNHFFLLLYSVQGRPGLLVGLFSDVAHGEGVLVVLLCNFLGQLALRIEAQLYGLGVVLARMYSGGV